MPHPLQTSPCSRLSAAVALVLASPVAQCGTPGLSASAWRQLRTAMEAFGGLVGVALIGLGALAILLLIDHVISRRDPQGEQRVPPVPAEQGHRDTNASN